MTTLEIKIPTIRRKLRPDLGDLFRHRRYPKVIAVCAATHFDHIDDRLQWALVDIVTGNRWLEPTSQDKLDLKDWKWLGPNVKITVEVL